MTHGDPYRPPADVPVRTLNSRKSAYLLAGGLFLSVVLFFAAGLYLAAPMPEVDNPPLPVTEVEDSGVIDYVSEFGASRSYPVTVPESNQVLEETEEAIRTQSYGQDLANE